MNAFYWAVIAACLWGVVPLFEKVGLSKVDPMVGLFYRCIGVLIGILILGLFVLKPAQIKSADLRSATFLILGGFIASFVAQIAFYYALKSGDVSKVVPISGSYPFISFLLAILLLGEHFTPFKLVGVILVIIGIWTLKVG